MRPAKTASPMILLAAIAVGGAVAAAASPTSPADDAERSCCVANPRHAGICKVALGPEETCRDVLEYLNNARSVGRTYCGNTTVRGGWKEVECQETSASGARRGRTR